MIYQEEPFTLYLPQLSDEAAFAFVQLLYELARSLEQHHSTQIAHYLESISQHLAESEPHEHHDHNLPL
ncbi:MAG: hypothetical protein ACREXY_15095 [Gammaproteobacteria bacterium]